ncbi:unnamed protein product [Rotaria sordida]|uniref:Uncharacterized protein n=1 Tax=Rotaria sordida TaxID=392033 RepID=A0A814ZUE5_9BILA|nr:unnamed protein product [Rotaria sordida]CAF1246947.1 unnamed protein product [Rotaria sordida]
MVAITRSTTAHQQQSSNTENMIIPAGATKVDKKNKVAKQCASSSTVFFSTQPIIATTGITATLGTYKMLSSHASNTTVCLDNTTSTVPTCLSEIESSHHPNSDNDGGVINPSTPNMGHF